MPYAFAKYFIEVEDLKDIGQVHAFITKDVKSAPKELTTQNALEMETMRELLDDSTEKSEMKSRIIEMLKKEI